MSWFKTFLAVSLVGSMLGAASHAFEEDTLNNEEPVIEQDVDESRIQELFGNGGQGAESNYYQPKIYAYRAYFGKHYGLWKYRLTNWHEMKKGCYVVASAKTPEDGYNHHQYTKYTLHSVANYDGYVDVWLNVDGYHHKPIWIDYIVICHPQHY